MKTVLSITIDAHIAAEIRSRNVNISKTVNDLLAMYLDVKKEDDVKFDAEAIKVEIAHRKAKLKEVEDLKREYDKRQEDAQKQIEYITKG